MKKLLAFLGGLGCLGTLLTMFLPLIATFVLITVIVLNSPVLLFNIKQVAKEVINQEEEIHLASLSNAIKQTLTGVANQRPDSTSWGTDVIDCGGTCNCQKVTYTAPTYKQNSIRFSNWTIQDPNITYTDTDYGKFVKRDCQKQGEADGTHKLFEYKISDFSKKQNITFESYDRSYSASSRHNISYTKEWTKNTTITCDNYETNPDLDIGGYATIHTVDGRIPCAFAPLVTAPKGSRAESNLINARTIFNQGGYWDGRESGFHGLWLWDGAYPLGTYIDVVFENNATGQQVVVPFIYCDAKNLHHDLNGYLWGQYTDQRWGQCSESLIQPANDRVVRRAGLVYDVVYTALPVTNMSEVPADCKSVSADYMMYDIVVGKQWTMQGQTELHDDEVVRLTHGYARLKVLSKTERQEETMYCSENDTRTFYGHTALELMAFQLHNLAPAENYSPNLICQKYIVAGEKLGQNEGCGTRSNWSIICMRAYNKQFDVNNPSWFKDQVANMQTKEISSSNQVIKICDNSCKCSICIRNAH